PVELLQIDAERAVEAEELGAHRLASRVSDTGSREAHAVAQRRVDEEITEPIEQPVHGVYRLAVEQVLAAALCHAQEIVEHALLNPARILHAHHDLGEQVLEYARGSEEIGWPDLAP